jgi:hypothetical protein
MNAGCHETIEGRGSHPRSPHGFKRPIIIRIRIIINNNNNNNNNNSDIHRRRQTKLFCSRDKNRNQKNLGINKGEIKRNSRHKTL